MTLQTQMVIGQALLDPAREWYGLEMVKATGLRSGTVYPIIERLLDAGWVTARWESFYDRGDRVGRPPRRYYRITEAGQAQAGQALVGASRAAEPVPWDAVSA